MEMFQIVVLHVAVFSVVGAALYCGRFAVRLARAVRLMIECRQLRLPE